MWLYRMHYSLRAPSALLFRLTLTKLLTSLIAEWYGVRQEVAQVQQGLTLLVLGWVTAC